MEATIVDRLERLNIWTRCGERAPHKPLLMLIALGALQRGEAFLRFVDYEEPLRECLREFGPTRSSYHPEYPFWRLQHDELWEVSSDAPMQSRVSNTDPTLQELRAKNAIGRFAQPLLRALVSNPKYITDLALRILSDHFPASIHQDILSGVGLSLERAWRTFRPRDPRFRARVLNAYEFRCAVCGFDLRFRNVAVALEAAHIRWYQAGGSDTESNGVALCSLHHKLFDLGAFTIAPGGIVLVSKHVHGSARCDEVLLRYHQQRIAPPAHDDHRPNPSNLAWHRREVFKEPPTS